MGRALDMVYEALDYQSGSLLKASDKPSADLGLDDWLEKGEWLAAARRAGADRVFFVGNNPVVVFAECGSDDLDRERAFNRVWCLGRPRLLFLASPGELSVLDLAQKPVDLSRPRHSDDQRRMHLNALETVVEIDKVSSKLQAFHRDHIESGKVFGDRLFGDVENRADKALIRDLKTVRRELMRVGLSGDNLGFAHALIGRSIFIRYLEDREILTPDYFERVARQDSSWPPFLQNSTLRPGLDLSESHSMYPRVLEDKAFTYALFKALSNDFNGDMFPGVSQEEQVVTQEHLRLIQDLLYGDVGVQKRLFFYSYRFDVVPLDLISSIYEEFYDPSTIDEVKKTKARLDGAYYTPTVLAELAISRVLTADELQKSPRVLDPACGSGVFLVEAFRRIVRHHWYTARRRLTFPELEEILREQIAGIEVNEEAARITAFSLYLALLHYLDPPAITEQIRAGGKLPNLLVRQNASKHYCPCIWVGDAFDTATLERNSKLASRFGEGCADIIVSNPPWGAPGGKADVATSERRNRMLDWCRRKGRTIGYKESSQAFLWRTVDLLRDGGKAAVLVSAGVLLKRGIKTQMFREQWMGDTRIDEVFNFAHVRDLFFRKAISPFAMIVFAKDSQSDSPVAYWSAKRVAASQDTQAILFSKYDVHVLRHEDLSSSEIWKTYWFGRLADWRFVRWLQGKPRIRQHLSSSVRGFERGQGASHAEELQRFKSLSRLESRYGPLVLVDTPASIRRRGAVDAYAGLRVLVNEGISQGCRPQGSIIAQFSDIPFAFERSIYALKLSEQEQWNHKVLLGILWSSLARYYFFMTTENWGIWHDKLLVEELLDFPVVLSREAIQSRKIIDIVDKLRNYDPPRRNLLDKDGIQQSEVEVHQRAWERELDKEVFDLYGLSDEQRDLIRDFCEVTLPFYYDPAKSKGASPAVQLGDASWLEEYIRTFARRWNPYLDDAMEMHAVVHVGASGDMVAVEFFPADKTDVWVVSVSRDSWKYILDQLGAALPQPMGISEIIVDGVVHAVSNDAVLVIKRNEKRFWTKSLSREDAEVSLCRRILGTQTEHRGQQ